MNRNDLLTKDPSYKSLTAPKYMLRYQSKVLIQRIRDAAKNNNRSINSEINARLMDSFNNEGLVQGEIIEMSAAGTPLVEGMLVNAVVGVGTLVGIIRQFGFDDETLAVRLFGIIEDAMIPIWIPIANVTPVLGGANVSADTARAS